MKINNIIAESKHKCPHCGGPVVEYSELMEKKDACYYKVKASSKVWPSAYASGRLVQCRKKGAGNYGNKSEGVKEAVNPAQQAAIAIAKKKKAGVEEAAPPGAKAERMVKHIKAGYAKDGKLSDVEKRKAFGAARKAHNKGVAEGEGRDKHYYLRNDIWRVMDGDELVHEYKPERYEVVGAKKLLARFDDEGYDVTHVISPMGVVTYLYGKPMDEGFDGEYDDEAGMADNNLETLSRAVEGIDDLIQSGDNLPEWCQEKIAVAKSMLVAVWDYMASEEDSDEVDPEVDEMFEAMDQLAEQLASKHRVSADTVWESFEALDDRMLYETAAWRRKEGKSKSGGLNAKGVASYRRENPGSKLQTAVTTKPSKLKKGSKAAKRRKSFCARMSGVKGPMKKPNGKPTRKALALRKWNC